MRSITLAQAQPEIQRRFIAGVYLRMMFALAITGAVAFGISQYVQLNYDAFRNFFAVNFKQIIWTAIIGELAVVFILSGCISKLNSAGAFILFILYSVLNGVSFSVYFLVFDITSIYKIFLITSLMFLGMTIYGFTTQSDLRSAGRYLTMALIGVIVASLLNILFKSNKLDWILSIISVGIFVGLTAYDTQRILNVAQYADGTDGYKKVAVIGALELYLDFINIFINLLRLFGKRK
ncbi:MAG: Bax inhibitor-1/YccA family protein [Treponema sp.]|nr:Bax inhibitor-1/YccA family protein [Candidatus Treponema scatequi]